MRVCLLCVFTNDFLTTKDHDISNKTGISLTKIGKTTGKTGKTTGKTGKTGKTTGRLLIFIRIKNPLSSSPGCIHEQILPDTPNLLFLY